MRIFEIVKENVNLREAAELYGIDVNRYGKALCPFHNDRNPSLYVADDHYYCFACGEHGDVIDFAGRLFQLSLYDAARKLMADFHLSPDKPPSAAALHAKRIRTEAQQLMENERLCFSVLSDYARVLRDWKVRYAPQSPDAPVHARFVEACHKLDEMEYYHTMVMADGWEYDISRVNIPTFLTAGTGSWDAGNATSKEQVTDDKNGVAQGICPLWSLQENYSLLPETVDKVIARKKNVDHGDSYKQFDGYMTAWFVYHLQGDTEAGKAFAIGGELSANSLYQDVQTNINE